MLQGMQHTPSSTVSSIGQPSREMPDEEHPYRNTLFFSNDLTCSNVSLLRFTEMITITFKTLLLISALPFSISAISSLIDMRASQNLSSSACERSHCFLSVRWIDENIEK